MGTFWLTLEGSDLVVFFFHSADVLRFLRSISLAVISITYIFNIEKKFKPMQLYKSQKTKLGMDFTEQSRLHIF